MHVALNAQIQLTISVSSDIASALRVYGEKAFGTSSDLVRSDIGMDYSLGIITMLQIDTILAITDETPDPLLSFGTGYSFGG